MLSISLPDNNGSTRPYQSWIDWFKVLGMAVILFGHTGGDRLIPPIFLPINPKQLGVAMFVFVTAFTLATETRSPLRVIYNRFFEVAVLGIALAMFLSVVQWFRIGDLNESNYLPFLLGLNVFWEDAFPANPTTWYVGTYLHLLLAWAAFLRFIPSRFYAFVGLAIADVGVRAAWMAFDRDFNAYMVLTSWWSVFWLGQWAGRSLSSDAPERSESAVDTTRGDHRSWLARWTAGNAVARRLIGGGALVALMAGWLTIVRAFDISKSNPFGRIPVGGHVWEALVTSGSVTVEYTLYTLLLFFIFYGIPAGRFVRFLSRNTLLVFLAHMPVRDWVTPLYYPLASEIPLISAGWTRQLMNFVVLFVGLAWVSEGIRTSLGWKRR